MLAAGCMSIKTTHDVKKEEIHVQMEASEDQLLANYNEQARAVQPCSDCGPDPSTGSTTVASSRNTRGSGVLLAKRPAMVRVIGQAPWSRQISSTW